jgi:hypothetical protein
VPDRPARRLAFATILLLVGCGNKARGAPPAVGAGLTPVDAAAGRELAHVDAGAPVPSLDVLAARSVRLAPGMHELARSDGSGPVSLPATSHDTCVRATFAASRPVAAALVSADGTTLAEAPATRDGTLGVEGPVCFRAQAAPQLRFGGSDGGVSYVVWGAP